MAYGPAKAATVLVVDVNRSMHDIALSSELHPQQAHDNTRIALTRSLLTGYIQSRLVNQIKSDVIAVVVVGVPLDETENPLFDDAADVPRGEHIPYSHIKLWKPLQRASVEFLESLDDLEEFNQQDDIELCCNEGDGRCRFRDSLIASFPTILSS